jgi:hypothetical protein
LLRTAFLTHQEARNISSDATLALCLAHWQAIAAAASSRHALSFSWMWIIIRKGVKMPKLNLPVIAATFASILAPAASADDLRCKAPPYGSTMVEFRAFVKDYGNIVVPTNLLADVCNAKYGAASRAALYHLGLSDEEIDAKDTVILAFDMIVAKTRLADALK